MRLPISDFPAVAPGKGTFINSCFSNKPTSSFLRKAR